MGIQRLKIHNPWKSYIYHIHTTEKKMYIGQSDSILDNSDRIDQHIKNAFYGKINNTDGGDTSDLYNFIRRKGLKNIDIHAFDAQNNYGFSSYDAFQAAYNQFTKEWAPGGKSLKYLGKNKQTKEVIKNNFNSKIAILDFVEITHLMTAYQRHYELYNKEMGGKVRGLVALDYEDNKKKKIQGSGGKKVLMPSMSPQDAYKMFAMQHDDSNAIALSTQELYSDMFSPDWANILATKYKDVDIPNRRNIQQSWHQFCTEDLFGTFIANEIKVLFENLTDPLQKQKFEQKVNNHIIEKFVKPREEAANKMIEYIQNLRNIKTSFNMKKYFKWMLLAKALTDPIVKASAKAFGKKDTPGITSIKNNFKLVSASFTWDLKHFSQNKVTIEWLCNGEDKGKPISTDYLKYEALVVFDYFVKSALHGKSKKWQKAFEKDDKDTKTENRIENEQKLEQGKKRQKEIQPAKPTFWKTDDGKEHQSKWGSAVFERTLSAKVHDLYREAGIDAYKDHWYEFYKPMITIWRNMNNYKPFTTYEKDSDYVTTPMKNYDNYNLLYSKNAILLNANLNTITVY